MSKHRKIKNILFSQNQKIRIDNKKFFLYSVGINLSQIIKTCNMHS